MTPAVAIENMRPGDMCICRVNKELIPTAYALIRRSIRPVIKGRDIGQGLIQLIERLEKAMEVIPIENEMGRAIEALHLYRCEEEMRLSLLGDRAENRLAALRDKCECLGEFIANSKTVTEMKARILSIFNDDVSGANTVVLGTVHRTKGLEAERVFVLAPELLPHPMAKRPWEQLQERNVAWIASTRAKFNSKTGAPGTIVFCGVIPAIYGATPRTETPKKAEEVQSINPPSQPSLESDTTANKPLKKANPEDHEPPF
jgi:hypothetical protein